MVHCCPANDERLHVLSLDCWCGPDIEWFTPAGHPYPDGPFVKHWAEDGREAVEEATGEGWTPDKHWRNFVV